jgi:methylenetetrahydrofolate reductase (NADPH)
LLPFEPNDFLETLAEHKKANPSFNITNVHFFPLGGINVNASWIKNATNN